MWREEIMSDVEWVAVSLRSSPSEGCTRTSRFETLIAKWSILCSFPADCLAAGSSGGGGVLGGRAVTCWYPRVLCAVQS